MAANESAAQAARDRRAEYADRLRERAPKGATMYTILRHESRSRMMRVISAYVIKDNKPVWLAWPWIAAVAGFPDDRRREGNRVDGVGEDKGFRLVYDLAHALYGDGYALNHAWL